MNPNLDQTRVYDLPSHLNRAERRAITFGRAFSLQREDHAVHFHDWEFEGVREDYDERFPHLTKLRTTLRTLDDGFLSPEFAAGMFGHYWSMACRDTGPEAYITALFGA